jgi:hypothetical protein
MNDLNSEREQVARIHSELSDDAKSLIVEVLRIENASLHIQSPTGVVDEIVRRVEGIIK